MGVGEIKVISRILYRAKTMGDWQQEIECLSALRLLYSREGDRLKEEQRITREWKLAIENAIRNYRQKMSRDKITALLKDLRNCYKFEASYDFRSFLVFMEWDRPAKDKFYQPRKKTLDQCVDALQDLEDGRLDILGISMPPRVGKSTLGILFILWVAGKHPEKSVFGSGHSNPLMQSFYDGVKEFATSDVYNYKEIFPAAQLVDTDAKTNQLDFGAVSRFKTISFASIDTSMSGRIEATSLLYVDDLISGIEEAMKPERLSNAYNKYETDIKQRRKDNVPMLMIGTRWSLNDPIGVEAKDNIDNPKAKFIVLPALNESGESNFEYDYGVGFTTKYYEDRKRVLDMIDPAIFLSVYQQTPIEAEGVCFNDSKLKRMNGEINPENIISRAMHVDVAWGGGDSVSAPIAYTVDAGGEKHALIIDWIFSRENKKVTQALIVSAIIDYKVQRVRFEANNGGDEYAEDVARELKRRGYSCEITWERAPTNTAKRDKILQYAPDIKEFFYFLPTRVQPQQYRRAMIELTSWLVTGKSPHDDAPDSLAGLSELVLGRRIGIISTGLDRRKYGI